jgi:cbb3-type cytochrome oxidase subunit 3
MATPPAISWWLNCFALLLLLQASGAVGDGNVTLQSLTIFNTHEWFGQKPEVYFRCQGESRVDLPDVKEKDQVYGFLGQESWQPLTTLVGTKCKRCGLFEKDTLKADDTFDEWELCPLEFTPSPEGLYTHFKEKEFNITLLCPNCHPQEEGVGPASVPADKAKSHGGLTAVLVVFILLCLGGLAFVAYSQWRRKQREEQQAVFVKLFEDDDFFDEELGLKDDL